MKMYPTAQNELGEKIKVVLFCSPWQYIHQVGESACLLYLKNLSTLSYFVMLRNICNFY